MPTRSELTVDGLRDALRQFNTAREWEQFHTPKNLAVGLVVEAAEVLEVLQWDESATPDEISPLTRQRLAEEIGDVMIYLVNITDKLELNPLQCAFDKLKTNEEKYPIARVRGSSKKYDEYDTESQ